MEEQNRKIVDGKVYKYNQTTFQFEGSPQIDGKYFINTRREYPATTDLLDQTGNYKETCYLSDGVVDYEYSQSSLGQSKALNLLGLTESEARSYEKYCQRTK